MWKRSPQGGTFLSETNISVPEGSLTPTDCRGLADVLSSVGDKWTIMVVGALSKGPLRYNEIQRRVSGTRSGCSRSHSSDSRSTALLPARCSRVFRPCGLRIDGTRTDSTCGARSSSSLGSTEQADHRGEPRQMRLLIHILGQQMTRIGRPLRPGGSKNRLHNEA